MKLKILTLSACVFGSSSVYSKESSDWSAGFGLFEFGGHFGAKYAYHLDEKNSLTLSAGIIGYAVGYERQISENLIAGISAGMQFSYAEDGFAVAKLNYYFSGANTSSWYVGASLGIKEDDGDCYVFCLNDDTEQLEATSGIHIGYKY